MYNVHGILASHVHYSIIHNSQNTQAKCPLIDGWVKKMWYMHTTEYHSVFFFFSFQGHTHHNGNSQARQLELQLSAYATATAMLDLSHICDLNHRSQQRQILNPWSEAMDWTHILSDTGWALNTLSHNGNPLFSLKKWKKFCHMWWHGWNWRPLYHVKLDNFKTNTAWFCLTENKIMVARG